MGLFDFTPEQSNGLLDFGTGMLAASGPSRMPVSLGQTFASGMQNMRAADTQRLHNKMLQSQMDMMPGQLEMQKRQINSAKISDDRKKAFEKMLPAMPNDVQQAYMMAGPEKAFDMWNQSRLMSGFDKMIAGQQTPAPRPYQGQVSGGFQLGTPDQQSQLLSDISKLQTTNPEEAAKVREALIQQGAIHAPMQQTQPDWSKIAEHSARLQLGGIKGASGMMKLAEFNKPNWTARDSGGRIDFVNTNSGDMPSPITKTMTPGEIASNQVAQGNLAVNQAGVDPDLQRQLAESKAAGKDTGEARVKASFELPNMIAKSEEAMRLSDELLKHPGFEQAVGASSLVGVQKVPGTDAYGFMNRLEQVKGGAFLEAFNSLKGGGQITEVEGKKATDAIARMDNATSEGDFKSAVADYKSAIQSAMNRAKMRGGQSPAQSAPVQADAAQPQKFDMLPAAKEYSGKRMQAENGTIYRSDGTRWVKE